MSASERRKGLVGEREVAALMSERGFDLRGLESSGDWLAFGHGLVLHVETKRQETARPWLWYAQAAAEAPVGSIPLVPFRRSRSEWLALAPFVPLLDALSRPTRLESVLDGAA